MSEPPGGRLQGQGPSAHRRTTAAGGASALAGQIAFWSLLVLVAVSLSVRPFTSFLGLSKALVNLDGAFTPVAAGLTAVAVLCTWRRQTRLVQLMTGSVVVLCAAPLLSWALGSTRTWAGLALGYASLLILPFAVYLAAVALTALPRRRVELLVLRVAVLAQIAFGLVQYFTHDVAANAPWAADRVDGTTSHNFWPAFALPAALALMLVTRGRERVLWPAAVAILAVYCEAKAALVLWVPAVLVVLAAQAWACRVRRPSAEERRHPSPEGLARWAAVGAFAAVVATGVYWSPSVQGTWQVFRGHTTDLEHFTEDQPTGTGQLTLRDSFARLQDEVAQRPATVVVGLGPGNSVSHAAAVLAEGTQSGVHLPAPGPVARDLLGGRRDDLEFRDAESSDVGLWGDLGLVGVICYLATLALCLMGLLRAVAADRLARSVALVLLPLGVLGAGFLLSWPEQSSIVLPIALSLLVIAVPRPADLEGTEKVRAAR